MTNLEGRVILRAAGGRAARRACAATSTSSPGSPSGSARRCRSRPTRRRSSPSSAGPRPAAGPTTPASPTTGSATSTASSGPARPPSTRARRGCSPTRFAHADGRARFVAVEHRGAGRAAVRRDVPAAPDHRPGARAVPVRRPDPPGPRRCPTTGRSSRCTRCWPTGSAPRDGEPVVVTTRRGELTAPARVVDDDPARTRCSCRSTGSAPTGSPTTPSTRPAGCRSSRSAPAAVARMTRPQRIVVVGAGMAAARLVEELVARGHDGDVTVLGDEPHPPYNRILLSAVLEGTHAADALTLRDPRGTPTTASTCASAPGSLDVDRDEPRGRARRRRTGSATTARARHRQHPDAAADPRPGADGRPAAPEGARVPHPRRLPAADAARCPARAQRGRRRRRPARPPGRPGAGASAASRPRSSRAASTCCAARSTPAAGAVLARDLRRLGTEVYTGARAVRLDRRRAACSTTASRLDTDLVVLTAGGRPSTALARRAGLTCAAASSSTHLARVTDDPRIHAIGDCAEHGGRITGFVPPAWEQAGAAGRAPDRRATRRTTARRTVARLRATGLDVAVLGDPERADGRGRRGHQPGRRHPPQAGGPRRRDRRPPPWSATCPGSG